MVCILCARLFKLRYYLKPGIEYIYGRKGRQLKANRDQCWMCNYLYLWLPGHEEQDEEEDNSFWNRLMQYTGYDRFKDVIDYRVRMEEIERNPGAYRLWIRFLSSTNRPLPPDHPTNKRFVFIPFEMARTFMPTNEMPDSSGSEDALDQALEWLVQCRSEHHLCNAYQEILKANESDFRPTRLIEIQPHSIRLHETTARSYQYVALTHRWPSVPDSLLTLTTSNYRSHLTSISQTVADRFSKVFSDAITVCRHLNINYIWIDSLCIIQSGDDYADWQKESLRMGDVYKHAVCTISATSIRDENKALSDGMFRDRDPTRLEPTIVECSFDTSAPETPGSLGMAVTKVFAKKTAKPGKYLFLPEENWMDSLTSAPIMMRGWVAQERLMSPRILYFATDQIWFDCYEFMGSEIYPSGNPIFTLGRPNRTRTMLQDITLHHAGLLPQDKMTPEQSLFIAENMQNTWMHMTCTFAVLRFSQNTDKLVAVAGMARSLMPFIGATPNDYKAGIWAQSFPYNLLWFTTPIRRPKTEQLPANSPYVLPGAVPVVPDLDAPQPALPMVSQPFLIRPPTAYQAPSWSWASINWAAGLSARRYETSFEPLVTLESFDISTLPADDPFARVLPNSSLTLRGTTYPATLTWHDAVKHDRTTGKFWPQLATKYGAFNQVNGDVVLPDERFLEGSTPEKKEDLRILPMLRAKRWKAEAKFMEILILEPVEGLGENVYRRFGIAEIKGPELCLPVLLQLFWNDVDKRREVVRII